MDPARNHRERVRRDCDDCGVCVKQCGFLQRHGTPQQIAAGYEAGDEKKAMIAYECNLCSLCTAVCPRSVAPQELFLEMRREAVKRGFASLKEHRGLLGYENIGRSRLLTWRHLPPGCDTVFFPGCALPGTRPEVTLKIWRRLRGEIENLGMVLDCCTKPSHDLGREEFFAGAFGGLKRSLLAHGIRQVLVACPNCWKVFTEHAPEFLVESVYETLAPNPSTVDGPPAPHGLVEQGPSTPAAGPSRPPSSLGTVTIHDPCAARFAQGQQAAVRRLAQSAGLTIQEMPHHGRRTLCCGEGGNVGAVAPELATAWIDRRAAESEGRRILTSCAGCAGRLSNYAPTYHILDLVADPARSFSRKALVSRGWKTYWNRFRLKVRLQREISGPGRRTTA